MTPVLPTPGNEQKMFSPSAEECAEQPLAGWAWWALALAMAPALLFWHMHGLWNPDGDYAYGWVVPLLTAYLFWRRWQDRPAKSPAILDASVGALLLALVMWPARWLQEAAPERSVCAWVYAAAGVGISLALLARVGGRAWLRWFAFPLAFVLTAVPWPHTLENMVAGTLMRGTAGATVEILCLLGIPSAQVGNLVHIETGVLDIDEACSGIRSLQAMVMIALFLGELFRLRLSRRLGLLFFGVTVTILANVARTVVLSSIGFHQGMTAVDRSHDAAGLAVLTVSLLTTLGVASRLRRADRAQPAFPSVPAKSGWPQGLCAALLVMMAFGEIAVETWYRWREPKWRGWSWAAEWPRQKEGFRFTPIPERSLRLLLCDASQAAAWKETDGGDWSMYWVRWNPDNPAGEVAKVHRPDVCLHAAGALLERDMGSRVLPVGRLPMLFHSYLFRAGDKPLVVFFCLFEEQAGDSTPEAVPRFGEADIVQRALRGRRHIGQQSLEIAVSGYPSEASALQAFQAHLEQIVHVDPPPEGAGMASASHPPP